MEEKTTKKTLNLDQIFAIYIFDTREKFHLSKKFGEFEKTENEWIKLIKEEGFEIEKF